MWVPTLAEVLEGLQRTLEREVIPAIDDPYVRIHAISVGLRLIGLTERWDTMGEWATLENEEMRAGLSACAEALYGPEIGNGQDEVTALAGDIVGQLERVYPPDPPRRSLASLADESQDLGQLMEDVIVRLEALQQADSSDRNLAEAREALRVVIRAQAERRDPGVDSADIQHPN